MERRSEGSRQYTIRGKIWAMIVSLAVTNAVVGAGVLFLGAMFVESLWIPGAVALSVSMLITIGSASVFANGVLRPVDKLNLLAKSIERTPGMSVPVTTGAAETDDLLHTVSRASRQLSNFVEIMDEVSAGKTDAARQPLEHADRLSESFQKLVAKVTDSIGAKAKLDRLEGAVHEISRDLSGLQRGEIVRIRTDFEGTRQITDALRSLLDHRAQCIQVIATNASDLKTLLSEGKNRVSAALEKEAALSRSLKKVISAVADVHTGSHASKRERSALLAPLSAFLEELKCDPLNEEDKAKSQAAVRRQFETAINKLRDVGEQSLAITHVAKAVQDLAKRSNMIALNASIHANGEDPSGLETLTQEIASLSDRAEKANKAIAGISDSVVRDVNEANASLHWVSTEVAKIVARTERTEETVHRVVDVLNVLQDASDKSDLELADSSNKDDAAIRQLEDCLDRCFEISNELRTCESSFEMLHEPLAAIRDLSGNAVPAFPAARPENGKLRGRFETDDIPPGVISDDLLAVNP